MGVDTVVFDMDGVLLDSEQVWNGVRREFARSWGGRWTEDDHRAVMGANSKQWAAYMHEHCGLDLPDEEIYAGVVWELRRRYDCDLPLIPGAREVVSAMGSVFRLGVASSSPQELIEYALELAGLRRYFTAIVSSDEVARGKPEPDVYLEACTRLGVSPRHAAAVEDSSSGIQAAARAGLAVVAIPNHTFEPSQAAVGLADAVLGSIGELTVEMIASLRLT